MKGVTSESGGTAYYVFSDLDMVIAGKTGSAETEEKDKVNGFGIQDLHHIIIQKLQ